MTPIPPAKKAWFQRWLDAAAAWVNVETDGQRDSRLIETFGEYGKLLEAKRLAEFDVGRAHQFSSETRRTYISVFGLPGSDGLGELVPAENRLIKCSCGWKLAEWPWGRVDPEKRRQLILQHQEVAIVEHQIAAINRAELGAEKAEPILDSE